MTSRLTLICQGATTATRGAAFPADEPLEERALSAIAALRPVDWRAEKALVSPRRAARETAEALGLDASEDLDLRDLDYGRWTGRMLADIGGEEPDGIARWLADADFDGHGGESIATMLRRAGGWLDQQADLRGQTVAVTHASVVKAMVIHILRAPPESFWLVDVAPLTLTDIRHDGRRWALRACGTPLVGKRPSRAKATGPQEPETGASRGD